MVYRKCYSGSSYNQPTTSVQPPSDDDIRLDMVGEIPYAVKVEHNLLPDEPYEFVINYNNVGVRLDEYIRTKIWGPSG